MKEQDKNLRKRTKQNRDLPDGIQMNGHKDAHWTQKNGWTQWEFNKETENIFLNQSKPKNTITEMKNTGHQKQITECRRTD